VAAGIFLLAWAGGGDARADLCSDMRRDDIASVIFTGQVVSVQSAADPTSSIVTFHVTESYRGWVSGLVTIRDELGSGFRVGTVYTVFAYPAYGGIATNRCMRNIEGPLTAAGGLTPQDVPGHRRLVSILRLGVVGIAVAAVIIGTVAWRRRRIPRSPLEPHV
jgi:hypothetical protein